MICRSAFYIRLNFYEFVLRHVLLQTLVIRSTPSTCTITCKKLVLTVADIISLIGTETEQTEQKRDYPILRCPRIVPVSEAHISSPSLTMIQTRCRRLMAIDMNSALVCM